MKIPKKIKKVIIPAGGLGTRFLPITKTVAKEMLPIIDKPCIQILVEEAIKSGIKDIIIITNKDKKEFENYFTKSSKLEKLLKEKNQLNLIKDLKKIQKSAKFTFINQNNPKGDGHAILQAFKIVKNEPFAVLFGDDIYESKTPALKQLIKIYEKTNAPVISLQKINKNDTEKYGIIDIKSKKNRLFEIKGFTEKPKPKNAPSNMAITGKYIITPELLKTLKNSKSHTKDKEIRLIDGMINLIKHSPIFGYEIQGERFDTGDKIGYIKAIIHFALKDESIKKEIKKLF